MKLKFIYLTAAALLLACSVSVAADPEEDQELARQAAFRAGMEDIVGGLNGGSIERFLASLDREDLVNRIFANHSDPAQAPKIPLAQTQSILVLKNCFHGFSQPSASLFPAISLGCIGM